MEAVTQAMRALHFERTGMYSTDAEILKWFKENMNE